jgi:hypothetical protein
VKCAEASSLFVLTDSHRRFLATLGAGAGRMRATGNLALRRSCLLDSRSSIHLYIVKSLSLVGCDPLDALMLSSRL